MNYLVNPGISQEIEGRETDPLTGNIIGAAIDVHRVLGPGLLESAYEACLIYELRLRRLFGWLMKRYSSERELML
jgi:PD-(D/E)XK nuclease superfamily